MNPVGLLAVELGPVPKAHTSNTIPLEVDGAMSAQSFTGLVLVWVPEFLHAAVPPVPTAVDGDGHVMAVSYGLVAAPTMSNNMKNGVLAVAQFTVISIGFAVTAFAA